MIVQRNIREEIDFLCEAMKVVFEHYIDYTHVDGRKGFTFKAPVNEFFDHDIDFFLKVMRTLEEQLNVQIPLKKEHELFRKFPTMKELFDHVYKYAFHNQAKWDSIKTKYSIEKFPS